MQLFYNIQILFIYIFQYNIYLYKSSKYIKQAQYFLYLNYKLYLLIKLCYTSASFSILINVYTDILFSNWLNLSPGLKISPNTNQKSLLFLIKVKICIKINFVTYVQTSQDDIFNYLIPCPFFKGFWNIYGKKVLLLCLVNIINKNNYTLRYSMFYRKLLPLIKSIFKNKVEEIFTTCFFQFLQYDTVILKKTRCFSIFNQTYNKTKSALLV